MRRSRVALIAVLGVAGGLVLAAVVFAFGYAVLNGVSSRPASEDEKKLIVDAAALAERGAEVDPKCGKYTTTRNIDATLNISYECDAESLYVLTEVEINPTERDARSSFVIEMGSYESGFALSQGTVHRRDDLLGRLGDNRYAAILRSEGSDAGNVFVVRQGRIVYSVLISGWYFDDAEGVQRLIQPVLEEGKRRQARKRSGR